MRPSKPRGSRYALFAGLLLHALHDPVLPASANFPAVRLHATHAPLVGL